MLKLEIHTVHFTMCPIKRVYTFEDGLIRSVAEVDPKGKAFFNICRQGALRLCPGLLQFRLELLPSTDHL